ncbi:MAG: hypothetical protein ACRDJX_07815 [Solirubrobacteraceae bacterium]
MRRLPVIDGHELIGVLSQGDLATGLGAEQVGELVGAISAQSSLPDARSNPRHSLRPLSRLPAQGAPGSARFR